MNPKKAVRRIAAALVVPMLVVSAAACGSDGGDSDGFPAVTGKAGEKPEVAEGDGDPPEELKIKVLEEGKGEKVAEGDTVNVDYLGQLWDGEVFDNSYDRGSAFTFEVGAGKVIEGWDEAVAGQKLGSRIEVVIPPEKGYGEEGSPPTIPADSTLVFVVDVNKTVPTKIDGKPVEEQDDALPAVDSEVGDKAPEIKVPEGEDAPDGVTSQTVVEGDGKEIGPKSTISAHYTAVLWNDGKLVGDTWQQGGPQELPVAGTEDQPGIPGWAEGLEGEKAGSRVMVVVPEEELTEEQRKEFESAVVFSVDILTVDES